MAAAAVCDQRQPLTTPASGTRRSCCRCPAGCADCSPCQHRCQLLQRPRQQQPRPRPRAPAQQHPHHPRRPPLPPAPLPAPALAQRPPERAWRRRHPPPWQCHTRRHRRSAAPGRAWVRGTHSWHAPHHHAPPPPPPASEAALCWHLRESCRAAARGRPPPRQRRMLRWGWARHCQPAACTRRRGGAEGAGGCCRDCLPAPAPANSAPPLDALA